MAWLAWVWLWRDSVVSTPVPKLPVLSGKELTDKASNPAAAQEPPAAAGPPVALAGKVQSPSPSPIGARLFDNAALLAAAQPTHWDLCGVGQIPIPPAPPLSAASAAELAALTKQWGPLNLVPELPRHWEEDRVASVLAQIMASLAQRGPRAQALAKYFAGAQGTTALLEQAERGGEAVVARWAVAACGRPEGESCAARAARQWVRADPQNAVAWAELLQADPTAESQALAGLAASTQYNFYDEWIAAELLAAVPAGTPEYLLRGLAIKVSLDLDPVFPPGLGVMRRCRPEPPGKPVPLWCAPLVELMLSQGDSHAARFFGMRMAMRLGWPAERLKAIETELDRFSSSKISGLFGVSPQRFACDEIRPLTKVFADMTRMGAYKAWLQHPEVVQAMAASAPSR